MVYYGKTQVGKTTRKSGQKYGILRMLGYVRRIGDDTVTKERVWWIPGGRRRVGEPLSGCR